MIGGWFLAGVFVGAVLYHLITDWIEMDKEMDKIDKDE
jgi:hypothetical protein